MHIVKINGGLGNQMFQYAFALALDARYGDAALDLSWIRSDPAHNGYELGRLFDVRIPECDEASRAALSNVDPGIAGKVRRRLGLVPRSQVIERRNGYDERYLEISGDRYFSGYWQSYKYSRDIEGEVRSSFTFAPPLSPKSEAFLARSADQPLIGVHVRRGDYLSYPRYAKVCGEAYYSAALVRAATSAADPLVVFFSDDLDWCRDRLAPSGEAAYIDWNRGPSSYEDMRLMMACDALVIANSSFSWWGAWLGERPGRKVIAPSRWLGGRARDNPDIIPPEWTRI